MTLGEPIFGRNAHIVCVDPTIDFVQDRQDPLSSEPDLAVWLVQEAMDDRRVLSVQRVLRRIAQWKGCDPLYMPPEAAVIGALWHDNTPFGVGYRMPRGSDYRMFVGFRNRCFLERRNGSLVPTSGNGVWPTSWPADMPERLRRVFDMLDAEGEDTTYLRRALDRVEEHQ
jgi:hypothetical protein